MDGIGLSNQYSGIVYSCQVPPRPWLSRLVSILETIFQKNEALVVNYSDLSGELRGVMWNVVSF